MGEAVGWSDRLKAVVDLVGAGTLARPFIGDRLADLLGQGKGVIEAQATIDAAEPVSRAPQLIPDEPRDAANEVGSGDIAGALEYTARDLGLSLGVPVDTLTGGESPVGSGWVQEGLTVHRGPGDIPVAVVEEAIRGNVWRVSTGAATGWKPPGSI